MGSPAEARCLSASEVEARKVTDEIAISLVEEPMWREFDEHLQKTHPDKYGKVLE